MDTESLIRRQRNDVNDTIIELTPTGGSTSETREVLPPSSVQQEQGTGSPTNNASAGRRKKMKVKQLGKQSYHHGLGEKREAMMIVSVLIATLTYQAALNPPGGFWQDDKPRSTDSGTARAPEAAGTAINSDINGFQWFLIANTVALFASLVIILILTSAKTVRRRRTMWVLMALMWISIFSVAFSFFCGVIIILKDLTEPAVKYLNYFGLGCMVLFALLVLLHFFIGLKEIYRWLKEKLSSSRSIRQRQNDDPASPSLSIKTS